MGLSRLDNFLKSVRGTILYVNPNDLDATDSIENQGNSLTRPFKTIQRALIESARFSYQKGLDNDRFGKTTILLYPGEHIVDNRPGYIPDGANNYLTRSGATTDNLPPYDLTSNFDLNSPDNELYKLNSVYGGVIIPRGTSLVGLDLRKTKLRPKYVPSPTNGDIERSAIFRITGECYFWQFCMFDADPNGKCYVDYTVNEFVPNFSHHKLTVFEYADGVNPVKINDEFITNFTTDRTDLDMYYEKVGLVYGQSSGRAIEPDYPSTGIDIQPKIDEYRIVGSTGKSVGITSIKAGDGTTTSTTITATLESALTGLDVDTPFKVSGITADGYNGQFVVSERPTNTSIVYQVQNAPLTPLPAVTGASLSITTDSVTSASPYVFNCSLRSVYGMCGMLADGAKATGFKSMVVAQYTGIGLQKDNNAFVVYNNDPIQPTGQYDDNTVAGNENLSTNSKAVYKPNYANFHIKIINDAFIQAVSVFAIGYAQQFVVESGGDLSLTNSNSNFGAKALNASGFKANSFTQDDVGYITHVIPPKEVPLAESAVEFESLDVLKTIPAPTGIGSTGRLYLYGQKNVDVKPENVIEGYRIGARANDNLKTLVSYGGSVTEYDAKIVMPNSQSSAEKVFNVDRGPTGINSIGTYSAGGNADEITFTSVPNFLTGESVRVISDTGQLPFGLDSNTLYYAITTAGISTNTNIKLAKTLNDALSHTAADPRAVTINDKGGALTVVSRVSDKNSGDIGHPIQFDTTNSQWYINASSTPADNTIFSTIVGLGTAGLGDATPRSFVNRRSDTRNSADTIYRARYVLPQDGGTARPPSDGYIVQESGDTTGATNAEIQTYFGSGSLTNVNQQRNFRFIAGATHSNVTKVATIQTELPHNLSVGSEVELINITSSTNTTGVGNSGFNGTYVVSGITSDKYFEVGITTATGTFTNDISARNTSLPYFKRKRYNDTYYVFRSEESQPYIAGEQDGVYYLTLLNASNKPTVSPFTAEKFSQPVKVLYPQTNRDNVTSDPEETASFATSELIGRVVVDDVRNSVTKETLTKFNRDNDIGIGVTNIYSGTGIAHTIHTSYAHGLNRLTQVSIANSGVGYGSGTAGDIYNARLVAIGASITGEGATAKLTVDSNGGITAVKIMDGGSAYGIGNTMAVVGTATTTGYSQAVLKVSQVYDNVGDTLKVVGVSSAANAGYNTLYRVTGVPVGSATSITVASQGSIAGFNTLGIGITDTANSYFYQTGESVRVTSLSYDYTSGIATVNTQNNHGLKVDNKVTFAGANQAQYNGDFVITDNISLTAFAINMGVGTTNPTATGTIYAYRDGFASNDGVITIDDENLNGRMVPTYAGITTTLSGEITNSTIDQVNVTGLTDLDINIGDYFMIDDEIVRVKTTTACGQAPTGPTNPVYVFRGVLGTKPTSHVINSVIRKISVNPIELRRHSILRASGHTFEYVGYGPGNYSTALPEKQDRQISTEEELLAQSTKKDAGVNFYTGMNDKGISYNGNKKLNSGTGQEEIYDTPVQTVTGEDIGNLPSLNVNQATEVAVTRSIRVEGGSDNKVASEFSGPVIVSNKLTSTSNKGIEAQSYYVQGDQTVSRKHTLAGTAPTLSGNPGDVVYYSDPADGGFVGWVYSSNNQWRRFGDVSLSKDTDVSIFDQVGIGTTSPLTNIVQVGGGSSIVSVDGSGNVGIATTNAGNFKLYVNGSTNIVGTVTATKFVGDGSGLTQINPSATGWTQLADPAGRGVYATDLADGTGSVGIATDNPSVNLEVGYTGLTTTSLKVHGIGQFVGVMSATNANVTGIITASDYDLDGGTGGSNTASVRSGIVTSINLNVGSGEITGVEIASGGAADATRVAGTYGYIPTTGGTGSGAQFQIVISSNGTPTVTLLAGGAGYLQNDIITIPNTSFGGSGAQVTITPSGVKTAVYTGVGTGSHDVGIGTQAPRAKLDIEGHARFKTYSEATDALAIVGTGVSIYLDKAQTFTLSAATAIDRFRLYNVPSGSTSFTIKIVNTGGVGVGINTFHVGAGNTFNVLWPGGVVPIVTTTTNATDIYSFKIFDGDNLSTAGMYGVIGGQNYA